MYPPEKSRSGPDYIAVALHFPVPVLRLRARGSEYFHVPFAAAPGLDHFGGDHIDQQFRKQASLRIAFEVIGGLVPPEIRVEHHRQEQVVAVVDHDKLSAGTLQRGMINEVFFGAVRADFSFQREFSRDDFFDGDFLVPAVAAVLLFASRLRDLLRTAERAPRLGDGLAWHPSNLSPLWGSSKFQDFRN